MIFNLKKPNNKFLYYISDSKLLKNKQIDIVLLGLLFMNSTSGYAGVTGEKDKKEEEIIVSASATEDNLSGNGYITENATVGGKTLMSVMKIPQSVSVVTRKQMDFLQSTNTSQVLRYTAGINSERYGANGSQLDMTKIRGLDADYYLDGLRVIGNPGSWLPQIDPWSLDRVEILRGPSSAMYGQGSGGGIVNQVSLRPLDDTTNRLFVRYGSFYDKEFGIDTTGPLDNDNRFLYRFTASGLDRQEQTEDMKHQRVYIAPAFTWRITPDTSWTLLATYDREPRTPDYNSLPTAVLGLNHSTYPQVNRHRNYTDAGFAHSSRMQNSFTSVFEQNFENGWKFESNARYMHVTSNLQRGVIYGANNIDGQLRFKGYDEISPSRSNSFSMDNHITGILYSGNFEHNLLGGVDSTYGQINTELYSVGPVLFSPYNDDYRPHIIRDFTSSRALPWTEHQTFTRIGGYLQDQITWNRWLLTLSARHDWSNTNDKTQSYSANTIQTEQNDHKWTGRSGLGYQFTPDLITYISYSTSFDPLIGTNYKGKPFKPVEAKQTEVGIKYHPVGSGTMISAALFSLEQTNMKTTDTEHLGFNTQTGKIKNQGFDIAATVALTPEMNLITGYTMLDSRIIKDPSYKDKHPAQIPRHSASGWFDYQFHTGILTGLKLGGGIRYLGSTWGDPSNSFKVKNTTLFDLGVSYDLFHYTGHDATFAVNASNLTNKHYIASCTSSSYCFIGQERTITAMLTYRW